MTEKVLAYPRDLVVQETYYNCGPASTQTVLRARGIDVAESYLANRIGTTENGTDYVGLIAPVLNEYVGGGYQVRYMPSDPPTAAQKALLWDDICKSIDAGFGVVANIVAPPSNYPRGVKGSVSPAYGGGTVFHYIAVMGYDSDARAVWIADSGFSPYGYWMSFDQLASLIPPKGYTANPTAPPVDIVVPVGLTAEVLSDAMGHALSLDQYADLLPAFVEALNQAGCNTVNRVAMWCAQLGHESGGLRWMEEIADGSDYEGDSNLGNTQPGDGRRFKGRGPIQVTGRFNYTKLSEWAFATGYVSSPTYFVDHPEELSGTRFGFLGAVWYWTVSRDLNYFADGGDIYGATRAVNGGLNGIDDRVARWNHCLELGDKLLPGENMDINLLKAAIYECLKVYVGPIGSDVKDIREQLCGAGQRDAGQYNGWKQLEDKTFVDGLASVMKDLDSALAGIARLEARK